MQEVIPKQPNMPLGCSVFTSMQVEQICPEDEIIESSNSVAAKMQG